MEKDQHVAKQMVMYANDAVEATYSDGTKIFLSPCATEYVIQHGHHNQMVTNKHRTIYTTSALLPLIRSILTFRNLYAQQPFLVPALVDSHQCYQSSGTATHVRWSPNVSLPSIDSKDPTGTWRWSSLCGRACIEVAANREIIFLTHPLQVSRVLTKSETDTDIPTKYIHIFAPVRRCFSSQRIPTYLSKFVKKCLQLIDSLSNNSRNIQLEDDDGEWNFELPAPLPSTSCPKAHRHRLHHQMMLESDLHILQTSSITYRIEYDQPSTIEALIFDDENQLPTEYIVTSDIQSSFYKYFSIKDQQCYLLTLFEHALPPQNERLTKIIRFMSTMRQQILTMARRVQEQPCWTPDTVESSLEIFDNSQSSISDVETTFDSNENSIYRQTFLLDIGHFKYFDNGYVQINFSNDFILDMTPEQVQLCKKHAYGTLQCRITDKKKKTVIDIFDGLTQPGCYEQYITAAIDWCRWIENEQRIDNERQLAAKIQDELFRIKLYRNRMEIDQYQKSSISNRSESINHSPEYYSPDDIQKILQRTAKFTRS